MTSVALMAALKNPGVCFNNITSKLLEMFCKRLLISVVKNRSFYQGVPASSIACGYVDKFNATNNLGNSVNYNNEITNRRDNLKVIKRFKYNKKQSKKEQDEEQDDDDLDEILEDKNVAVLSLKVNSLRLDLILKGGLNIARNKVETAFYESRIRVNGRRVLKKSEQVRIGDEIDIVRGPSPTNPDFLVVSRIQLLTAKESAENISIKLTRNKALVIENYSDPWKVGSSQGV